MPCARPIGLGRANAPFYLPVFILLIEPAPLDHDSSSSRLIEGLIVVQSKRLIRKEAHLTSSKEPIEDVGRHCPQFKLSGAGCFVARSRFVGVWKIPALRLIEQLLALSRAPWQHG
jgi:hypothetical protein